ncbi:FmdB family zinc ribbon protein [Candidatus Bipolaricaulota bacterium]
MPFYRYECRNCGYDFRHLHRDGVDEEVACPKCKGTDLERRLPRVAVQFKGSGYYTTDRANKKSKAGTKGASEKDDSAGGDSKESKKSDESKSDKPAESSDGS